MLVSNKITGIFVLLFSLLVLTGCKTNNDEKDKEGNKETSTTELIDAKKIADSSGAIKSLEDNTSSTNAGGGEFDYKKFKNESSAPQRMFEFFNNSKLAQKYDIDLFSNNPYYLHGDFDGDGMEDYLLNLKHKTGDLENDLVLFAGNKKIYELSKDATLELPANDAWYVHNKNVPLKSNEYDTTEYPILHGDAIITMKLESSSAIIYWDGKKFKSYWLGD